MHFILCPCHEVVQRPDSHVIAEFMSLGLYKHLAMQNALV